MFDAAKERALAYETLGIEPDQVYAAPQISPTLRQIITDIKKANRGVNSRFTPTAPMNYLRASEAEEARKVVACHDKLPPTRAALMPLEAFCVAAQVSPLRILDIIVSTAVRLSAQASTMVAAINHPAVVQATVDSAMMLGKSGSKDREMLHKATQFLPQPRASQTFINLSQSQQQAALTVGAPPPEQTIRKLTDRFHASADLLAKAGSPAALPAQVEGEHLPPGVVRVEGELVPLVPPDAQEYEEEFDEGSEEDARA